MDFKNTIILLDFQPGSALPRLTSVAPMGFSSPGGGQQKVEDQVMAEVKKAFNPEFLNRLDETILFTSLSDEDLMKIIQLLMAQVNKNLVAKQITIRLNDDAAMLSSGQNLARNLRQLRRTGSRAGHSRNTLRIRSARL